MPKIGPAELAGWKREQRRFACLTAHDAPTARIVARAGIPLILVGDSLGNSVLGYADTLPVTMEEMLHHSRAVRRGAPESFIVGDMPFLSYQVSDDDAVRNAGRFLKEGGADAVKIEGGGPRARTIERLLDAGIPVMGHLGLTPQTATLLGGYRVQGRDAAAAAGLLREAHALEAAGVFALVLECVPEEVGAAITKAIGVPTIGIGAGRGCDGQILVLYDLLGIRGGYDARFVRRYANLEEVIGNAAGKFARDVESGEFPSEEEIYRMPAEERARFEGLEHGDGGHG